jgi:hypothetical protein
MNVLMVHSSILAITTDGEHLTCGGFSLHEIVRFRSLEFIVNCFSGLSLSPKGSDSDTVFVRVTHGGSPSLWTILEEFIDEFYTTSSGERERHSVSHWSFNFNFLQLRMGIDGGGSGEEGKQWGDRCGRRGGSFLGTGRRGVLSWRWRRAWVVAAVRLGIGERRKKIVIGLDGPKQAGCIATGKIKDGCLGELGQKESGPNWGGALAD